jgi:hypothetical protein
LDDGSDENSRPSPGAAGEVPPGLARCGTRTHGCSATGMSTDSGLDNGSRMTRECHVRFCERLRGRFPRSTQHFGMKAHIGVDSKSKQIHSKLVIQVTNVYTYSKYSGENSPSCVVLTLLNGKYKGRRKLIDVHNGMPDLLIAKSLGKGEYR